MPDHSHGSHDHDLLGAEYSQGSWMDLSTAQAQNSYAENFIVPIPVGSGPPTVPVGSVPSSVSVLVGGVDATAQLGGPWGTGAPFESGLMNLTPFISSQGIVDVEFVVAGGGGRLTYSVLLR